MRTPGQREYTRQITIARSAARLCWANGHPADAVQALIDLAPAGSLYRSLLYPAGWYQRVNVGHARALSVAYANTGPVEALTGPSRGLHDPVIVNL